MDAFLRHKPCPVCRGHGFEYSDDPRNACFACWGSGYEMGKPAVGVPVPPAVLEFIASGQGVCHRCIGTGHIFSFEHNDTIACPVCRPLRLPDGSIFLRTGSSQ